MARGKLFIIEAGDGSGKETQTRLLTQRLIREGHRVRAVTYASYRMKWREDYAAGTIILADRYTTSNMVHQAVKIGDAAERDAFLDWLYDFEFNKLGLPVPDAVFFLDMEPCAAERLIAARAQAKGETPDIHERDADYLRRTHDAYVLLAARCGWVRIPSSADGVPLPIEEIHERLYAEVGKFLTTGRESHA